MMEMLAVVMLIGILAAAASPYFINMMKDRRVNRAAMQLVDFYRTARTRALGRGAAVNVIWNSAASSKGTVELREAVLDVATNDLAPSTNCVSTDWTVTSATSRRLSFFNYDTGAANLYELAVINAYDPLGQSQAYLEICFSPRGRTFYRTNASAPMALLAGVPTFRVNRLIDPANTTLFGGLVRVVNIPPNGAARLVL